MSLKYKSLKAERCEFIDRNVRNGKDVWHATHLFVILVEVSIGALCAAEWKGIKMAVFQIAALAVFILFIAYREKETLVEVIPVAVCLLILLLYGLSFFNALTISDYLAVFICLLAAVCYFRQPAEKRKQITDYCLLELKSPAAITALVLLIAVPVLTGSKAVTWWDDFNFWTTDVKSVFYLNGFAGKYRNAAPEFGDYPPGTQMMKWWFLHMHPSYLKEGLMFSGYYFTNLAFLVPLLKHLKKRNVFLMILAAAALWIFPSCVEVFGYDGCCADLTMAVIYGAFLVSVVDREGHSRLFYYGRLALFLMVLVLCKNVGFLWVAFGLLFLYGYHAFIRKEKGERLWILLTTLLPVITECSWLLFCLINRRVAKLTGTALHMATGSINVPDVQQEMMNAYVTAFLRYPLHRWSTAAIDLSPLALYLLLLLFVFLLYKRGRIEKRQGIYFGCFLAISGICFYAINLLSHLTIFAVETQYLEPFGMVSSMERYGAPFTIGGLYLIAYLVLRRQETSAVAEAGKRSDMADRFIVAAFKQSGGLLLCLVFVFATADYSSAYRGLIGYRSSIAENQQAIADIIDDAADDFLTAVGAGQENNQGRVLYLRDISDISWVRNTYISYEAAPVSVMYGNVDAKTMSSADIAEAIADAHAGYLYVDEIQNDSGTFASLTEEGVFDYKCLYQVIENDGSVILKKADNGALTK